jgi:hypothetical protein
MRVEKFVEWQTFLFSHGEMEINMFELILQLATILGYAHANQKKQISILKY